MIILEGMDGTGKTTLGKSLMINYPEITRFLRSPGELQSDPNRVLLWCLTAMMSKTQVLYDRFPIISEEIYGNVIRGKNILAEKFDLETLFTLLAQANPLVIYCRTDSDTIMANLKASMSNQMEGVWRTKEELIYRYSDLMTELKRAYHFNIVEYNYRLKSSLPALKTLVDLYLKEIKH